MRVSGFSLIEVNMAVFVLAVGILSMAVLYPLGLRESMQSQADIKQSMFADYVLSLAVAQASKTEPGAVFDVTRESIIKVVSDAVGAEEAFKYESGETYEYEFEVIQVKERSDYLLGLMVRSLDTDMGRGPSEAKRNRLQAQPLYYAELRY
jgi:Tfp pilus assembly protein PilV